MSLKIINPGPLTTIQDLGRVGYQQFGVPVSGAMDDYALRAANALVGNAENCAALEFGLVGPTLEVLEPSLIAVTGAGFEVYVQDRRLPTWTALFVRRHWTIRLVNNQRGSWGYLGIAGGVQGPLVLGSRATYVRGGLGQALQIGEALTAGDPSRPLLSLAGQHIPEDRRPAYSDQPTVEVILGPQLDRFTDAGLNTFLSSEYTISRVSDRMGYRLAGPTIAHRSGADIISDGIVLGAVQVPASGQPIVMMSERPTTGGYTKIAAVISADMPVLAQCRPGFDRVRFRAATVEAAQDRYRALMRGLKAGIVV